jgi:hypothetical protein
MIQLVEATKAERTAMGEAGRAVVEESHDLAKLGEEFVAMLWPDIAAGTRASTSASSPSGLL